MVSHRKRKKQAREQGLTEPELRMVELLEELVEGVRWLQGLGWSNQFTLQQKLKLPQAERDQILEAAARAVDADGRTNRWQEQVSQLKGEIVGLTRAVRRARKDMEQGVPRPESLGGGEGAGDSQGAVQDGDG